MATHESRDYLLRQLETAWKLASFHLDGLTTEECLWRPAAQGLHVRRLADGKWRADWPDRESYDLGPPSIAWVTWHIIFWWSMVLDHSLRNGTLSRESVTWPGDADAVRAALARLHGEWRSLIETMSDDDLRATGRTRWPFRERPFGDVAAWVNIELAKNASEIGYARFLHAVPER
jgi:DinB superfamily